VPSDCRGCGPGATPRLVAAGRWRCPTGGRCLVLKRRKAPPDQVRMRVSSRLKAEPLTSPA
jgi:hypothetical protein